MINLLVEQALQDIAVLYEEQYLVPKAKKKKVRDFNPRTNRMKKFKRTDYLKTNIPPEKRTFKNKPDAVRFQDWLGIKGEKREPGHSVTSFGRGFNGQWCGWSHRAVACFQIGKIVPKTCCGNIKPGTKWTVKTDDEAKKQAMAFADDVS